MRLRRFAQAAALLVLAAVAAAGPPVPPAPRDFVTDTAGVLSADTETALESRLRTFEAETSNQLLVYVAPRVPDGTTLEEYTVAAAEAWGAGGKERDNGLVLFVFPESRKARIEVGKGLEGALPDVLAGRIVRDEAAPRFAKGDWDGGVTVAVDAMIAATKGEYRGTGRRARGQWVDDFPWTFVLFFVFFVLPVLVSFRRRRYWYMRGGGYGSGSFGGWTGGGSSGGWSGGGGGGGGFSGGGGSFGGGGASGSW